jgi:hypothetical protein
MAIRGIFPNTGTAFVLIATDDGRTYAIDRATLGRPGPLTAHAGDPPPDRALVATAWGLVAWSDVAWATRLEGVEVRPGGEVALVPADGSRRVPLDPVEVATLAVVARRA